MLSFNNQAHGVRKKIIIVPKLLQDYIVLGDVVLVSLRYVKELMEKGVNGDMLVVELTNTKGR